MTHSTEFDPNRYSQFIVAANIASKVAATSASTKDSARSWDRYEGFIDATNYDPTSQETSASYQIVLDHCAEMLRSTRQIQNDIDLVNVEEKQKRKFIEWHRLVPLVFPSKLKPDIADFVTTWSTGHEWTHPHAFATTVETQEDDTELLLYLNFSNEIDRLERNISASVRDPIRERLRFLLDASIQEKSDEQDALKISSLQGFYKFLEYSQSSSIPRLTLTCDGHIYGHWRESNIKAIGARFVSASQVNFAFRNNSERGSISSTPARFCEAIGSLGLTSILTDSTR